MLNSLIDALFTLAFVFVFLTSTLALFLACSAIQREA